MASLVELATGSGFSSSWSSMPSPTQGEAEVEDVAVVDHAESTAAATWIMQWAGTCLHRIGSADRLEQVRTAALANREGTRRGQRS